MYMYMDTYIYIYICIYIHMYIYIYTYIYILHVSCRSCTTQGQPACFHGEQRFTQAEPQERITLSKERRRSP